ncbi:MAG: hypothetical protein ACXVQR_04185 [Solirubrobacteraceae bacterium]
MTLWPSPWPAEDGGPQRRQAPLGSAGLAIGDHEQLRVVAARDAFATTMVVLRAPGEVFALRHTMGRKPHRDPSVAWVERIDPLNLRPLARSPELQAGPLWPGGMAAHANGSLYVVYGRFCHRLSPGLELLASRELARPRPYNSFVVLGDGTLAMKDLDRSLSEPAHLTLLDPQSLSPVGPEIVLPEPSVARLAADDNALYVVGTTTAWRYHWDGARLERDGNWQVHYHGGPRHSYGWDPVIAGGQLWFLDNGDHDYATTMRGAGRAPGPARLIRASLHDAADHEAVEICGAARDTVTDPPLYDAERRVAIGYDSGNGVVQAFRFGTSLEPLWRRELAHAGHMIHYPDTGELVLHDFRGPGFAHTRLGRAAARASSGLARSRAVRRAMARRTGDDVLVVDIETGAERARAHVPSMFQSVLFPAPGFGRDLYWCTFSTLARLEVA